MDEARVVDGVGGGTQLVAVLPLALAAPILLPIAPPLARKRALGAAGALIAAGLAIATWVRLDPVAATMPTYGSFR